MIRRSITILTLLFSLFSFTNCASIVSDTSGPVTINSSPPGAEATIKKASGGVIARGKTPFTQTLETGHGYFDAAEYTIEAEKQGYYKASRPVDASLDPWYIGNLVFGGSIGFLIVDPATGAMFQIEDQVHINLQKKKEGK